jgi:hypothetical protein
LKFFDNGIIQDCDHASEQLLQCSSNELIGYHFSKVISQLIEMQSVQSDQSDLFLKLFMRIGYRLDSFFNDRSSYKDGDEQIFTDMKNIDHIFIRATIRCSEKNTSLTILYTSKDCDELKNSVSIDAHSE